MSIFDTLIRFDTLIFLQALGLTDRIIKEVKIQHVNSRRNKG